MINPKTIFVYAIVIFVSGILLTMFFNIGRDYYILKNTHNSKPILDDTIGVLLVTDASLNANVNELLNANNSSIYQSNFGQKFISNMQKETMVYFFLILVWIIGLTWLALKFLPSDWSAISRWILAIVIALGTLAVIEVVYFRMVNHQFIIPFVGMKNFIWNWDKIFNVESFFMK